MHRTYAYRLEGLTAAKHRRLEALFWRLGWLRNETVAYMRERYAEGEKTPFRHDLSSGLTKEPAIDERTGKRGTRPPRSIIARVRNGYARFRKLGAGRPRSRNIESGVHSFECEQTRPRARDPVQNGERYVHCKGLGRFSFTDSRGVLDKAEVKAARIVRTPLRYEMQLVCEAGEGLVATDDTRRRRFQRKAARAGRGSNARKKAKALLAKELRRIAVRRRSAAHRLTTATVRDRSANRAAEELNLTNMTCSGGSQKRGWNRALLNQSLGQTGMQLVYKSERAGGEAANVPPQNATRQCRECLASPDQRMTLNVRACECEHCGYRTDRDVNAARNIRRRGMSRRRAELFLVGQAEEAGVRKTFPPIAGRKAITRNRSVDATEEVHPCRMARMRVVAGVVRAGRLWTGLLCGIFFCVAPAQGQTVRDEGFPAKPVSSEAFPEASGDENCVAALFPGEFEERCAEDNEAKAPDPFGEQGRLSALDASDPLWNAPPRLECPSAVFLEEMETASIDCHAWDATGEEASDEAIDFEWELTGGERRDYMEHPRLTPEDSPQPLLIAPSSPFYDTLESFLAEETTKKYRYRLRATSRATGLSSFAEVDVLVLLNRPSVHCPLEVEVEEGSTVALSCEGADPLSFRMDEEAGSSAAWEWEGLWGANTSALSSTDLPAPFFRAPWGSAGETYHYVASMTTTSSGVPRTARRKVSVTVVESEKAGKTAGNEFGLACDATKYLTFATSVNFTLDCEAPDAPDGATWTWTARDTTPNTGKLSATDIRNPTFNVPGSISGNVVFEWYHYTVSVSKNSQSQDKDVSVQVLRQSNTQINFTSAFDFYEGETGSSIGNFGITQRATYPDGNSTVISFESDRFTYEWRAWQPSDMQLLSEPNIHNPIFNVPQDVNGNQTYKYSVQLQMFSGIPPIHRPFDITVTVLERPDITVTCKDPDPVYEGHADPVELSCSASGAPGANPSYLYRWRGFRKDLSLLTVSAKDSSKATFAVPKDVPQTTKYKYGVAAFAPNADGQAGLVTVTVMDKLDDVGLKCPGNPYVVYEGDDALDLDCEAKDAPSDASYVWSHRGFTADTNLLTETDGPTPKFRVPKDVPKDETYEYTLSVSAPSMHDATTEVDVTVKNRGAVTLTCDDPEPVYEGHAQPVALSCSASGGSSYSYSWTGADMNLLTIDKRDSSRAAFAVPKDVAGETTYEYTVTASAPNAEDGMDKVTVTVMERHDIALMCEADPEEVFEGPGKEVALSCKASGAPSGSSYSYSWAGAELSLLAVDAQDASKAAFKAPEEVTKDEDYEYTVTATAPNADEGEAKVTVTVREKPDITLACEDPEPVYEGHPEAVALSCSASGAPGANPSYSYSWTGANMDLLTFSAPDSSKAAFAVPKDVSQDKDYEYTVTATAPDADEGEAKITVTVKERPDIALSCEDPEPVYEGYPEAVELSCTAENAPGANPTYSYAWTGADMDLLTVDAQDASMAAFEVPKEVTKNEEYEYTVTATAKDADEGAATVTVTVLEKPDISIACEYEKQALEGSDPITIECEASGAPAGASYDYLWYPADPSMDTDLLSETMISSPTFMTPSNVEKTTKYEYRLTASSPQADPATEDVSITVLKAGAIAVSCPGDPWSEYEGSAAFALECSAEGIPEGSQPAYSWAARGSTADAELLSETEVLSPMFKTPSEVSADEKYEYTLTVTAEGAEKGAAEVTVNVLNRPSIAVSCEQPEAVYEGSDPFAFECEATGAPAGSAYEYEWTALRAADLSLLSAADDPAPTFTAPAEVSRTTTYAYRLAVSAENAEDGMAKVEVTVKKKGAIAVTCAGSPYSAYEGSGDVITFECEAAGAPDDSDYAYSWEALGAADVGLLSATDVPSPTFLVPDDVEGTTTYAYRLAVSADNAEDGMAEVRVTAIERPDILVMCANPGSVYEGSDPFAFECEATGAPDGSEYAYSWTALGAADISLLSAADVPSPTFRVPADVERTTRHAYELTVSAENADAGMAEVRVAVLNAGAIAVSCPGSPYSAYEGEAAIAIECEAEGGPRDAAYEYAWEAWGATADLSLLSATDGPATAFSVPAEVEEDETYEYRLAVSAPGAEGGDALVSVTVRDRAAIALACAQPAPVYEGSADVALDCSAPGAPAGTSYAWEALSAADIDRLSAADVLSPSFDVPDAVGRDETYEYRLTASAPGAETATADVMVTVLDRPAIALACPGNPYSAYEGSEAIALDCSAPDAPQGTSYAWEALGAAADIGLLSAADVASPMFLVPAEVDQDETYEYRLTATAENAEPASIDISVSALNKPAIAVACPGNPYSASEGAEDIALECSATGAPEGSDYEYAWEALGAAADIDLLSAADISSPAFDVPASVEADETYEYRLTVSAENAEPASADVSVTVLDRPVSDLAALGVAVEASLLRFGTQAANTQAALDPLTDRITNSLSGPYNATYHAGRMTLALSDAEAEAALSMELLSPVALTLASDAAAPPLALAPTWSYAASCEQKASTAIRGAVMEAALSEAEDCRQLLFGGALDLAGARPGLYEGRIHVVLRSGAAEETHSIPVEAQVAPASRTITIGPGGARFGAAREAPAALTREQNLSVYPDLAFLTEEAPSGAFALSNPSLVPLEISVAARFGYAEATADGREILVEDEAASRLGDLSEWVEIYPRTLTLEPGEEGVARYGVPAEARAKLAEAGYAAFFEITSSPRRYVRADRMPQEASGTARVTLRAPAAYATGEGPSRLTAELLSTSQGASPAATFLVETEGRPFAGDVVAYGADGREFGRGRTLVYTRSRARLALERIPEEGEAMLLRFVPLDPGRAPEPVAIRWRLPGKGPQEIGAAMER